MLEHLASGRRPGVGPGRAPDGRRVLDLAEGVLVGANRYSIDAAFTDLVAVAHRHDVTVSALACALVALATRDGDVAELSPVETAIAQHAWGDLLPAAGWARQ